MNQENVKDVLLKLKDAPLEFSLIFSGKKSRKVNGLYKPETREIIIHNKNFALDNGVNTNSLIYTAIHEYAHHLHACKRGGKLSSKAHTTEFWAIFHDLLEIAEKKGLYKNTISESPELIKLTDLIRTKYLIENGKLVKELGSNLFKAFECCKEIGIRFEDYIDRILCIPRVAARMAMKMSEYDLKPATGPDNMRYLAGISNPEEREQAQELLLNGKSPDSVRMQIRAGTKPEENVQLKLEKEKLRLEHTIQSLSARLTEVEKELKSFHTQ